MKQFYNEENLISNQQILVKLDVSSKKYQQMRHTFYREIYKIDNQNCEQYPHQLINLLKNASISQSQENNFIQIGLQLQMQHMNRKNIYVGIKWLIFIHQTIQITNSIDVLTMINRFIQLITLPYASQKIEEYIRNKLFNPYRHYLTKLVLKKIHKIQDADSQEQSKHQIYGEYNFINYSISEFAISIRELTPFLEAQYPYLNLYIDLISQDMMPIYKKVLHSFEENLMSKLTFIEMENMATKMLIFTTLKKDQKSVEATTGNSSSSNNNNSPKTTKSITPFMSLQSSNIGLNILP